MSAIYMLLKVFLKIKTKSSSEKYLGLTNDSNDNKKYKDANWIKSIYLILPLQ